MKSFALKMSWEKFIKNFGNDSQKYEINFLIEEHHIDGHDMSTHILVCRL